MKLGVNTDTAETNETKGHYYGKLLWWKMFLANGYVVVITCDFKLVIIIAF